MISGGDARSKRSSNHVDRPGNDYEQQQQQLEDEERLESISDLKVTPARRKWITAFNKVCEQMDRVSDVIEHNFWRGKYQK